MTPDLRTIARALGGVVSGDQVLAPGPGHSAKDRSLSVKLAADDPDGFVVNSFAGDDWQTCKDHVRQHLGIPERVFDGKQMKNGHTAGRKGDGRAEVGPDWKHPEGEFIYHDEKGAVLYKSVRYPLIHSDGSPVYSKKGKRDKTFVQYVPNGNIWKISKGDIKNPVPYHLPRILTEIESAKAAGDIPLILIFEGERKADLVHGSTWPESDLTIAATSIPTGAKDYSEYFAGANVWIVPDNDAPGRNYLQKVAAEIYPAAKSVSVVELPGLGEGEDIEDWLPKHEREEFFAAIDAAPEWRPDGNAVNLPITRPTTHIAPVTGEEKLNRLLAEYAIVLIGGSARIIGWKRRRLYAGDGGEHEVPNLIRPDAFRLFHRDKFQAIKGADGKTGRQQLANLFLDQARRFDDLVFIPGADPTVGNQLNLWRGFGIAPKAGKWPLMRDHIRNVIAGGVKEHDAYIVRWCAWAMQNPGKQAEVALVIRGGKGGGKGSFGNSMCRIFGPHGLQIADRKHLIGAFNMHLSQCALLFADEAYWPGDKEGEGALKRLITEPTLTIEPKGVDPFTVTNNLHVIISGNDEWIVPASGDERRYAVFDISNQRQGDLDYFQALHTEFENGGLAAMLHDLLAVKLDGWHPRKNVPQTKAPQTQKAHSRRGVDRLIEIVAAEGTIPCVHMVLPDVAITTGEGDGKGFYAQAKNLVLDLKHTSSIVLLRTLAEQWGCEQWRTASQRGIKFPPLAELREAFVKRHGPIEWAPCDAWGDDR